MHRQYSIGSKIGRRQNRIEECLCSELAFVFVLNLAGALRFECRNPTMHFRVLPLRNLTEAEPDCPEQIDRQA